MPNSGKNILIWLCLGVLLIALFNIVQGDATHAGYTRLAFSEFLGKVDQSQVSDVTIRDSASKGSLITGHGSDGAAFVTQAPDYPSLIDHLTEKNVKISAIDDSKSDSFWSAVISWVVVPGLFIAAYM